MKKKLEQARIQFEGALAHLMEVASKSRNVEFQGAAMDVVVKIRKYHETMLDSRKIASKRKP